MFIFIGKLGHGDTNRVYKPKVIEALQGMFIRKVCAGSQSSLSLTSTGQVRLRDEHEGLYHFLELGDKKVIQNLKLKKTFKTYMFSPV